MTRESERCARKSPDEGGARMDISRHKSATAALSSKLGRYLSLASDLASFLPALDCVVVSYRVAYR